MDGQDHRSERNGPADEDYEAHVVDTSDDDDGDLEIEVVVRCPHCPFEFEGVRAAVEEALFDHIWRLHEESSIEYMLQNMYLPEHVKEMLFEELGPDYISWLVDTRGEVVMRERPTLSRERDRL